MICWPRESTTVVDVSIFSTSFLMSGTNTINLFAAADRAKITGSIRLSVICCKMHTIVMRQVRKVYIGLNVWN